MTDAYCAYGDDFQIDQFGCILEAVGWDEVEQEISRTLYTCPSGVDKLGNYLQPDWIFFPTFGLGLPRQIGNLYQQTYKDEIITKCNQAIVSNPEVLKYPPPKISIFQDQHALNLFLTVPLKNQQPGEIVFELGAL